MSGTLRGEIWGLSFAATHSAEDKRINDDDNNNFAR